MMVVLVLVLAACLGVVVFLILSEISHRRYIRRYNEITQELYGRRGGSHD